MNKQPLSERSPVLRFGKNWREVGFAQAIKNEVRASKAFWMRAIKIVLFVVVSFLTIIALFYAEENWRGKRAWDNYKRDLAQKGEPLNLVALAPPVVPDEQNFAMTPLLKPLLDYDRTRPGPVQWNDTNAYNYVSQVGPHYPNRNIEIKFGEWTKGKRTDLRAWQQYYRTNAGPNAATNFFPIAKEEQAPAKDVLLALSKFDREIEELRSASFRPYSRFPIHYQKEDLWGILLPHLMRVKILTTLTSLRAVAELENGESQKAFEDVQLAFHIAQSVKDEPILISQLVRFASIDFVIQPIWEGIQDHRWSDVQLAEFQRMFQTQDFLAEYPRMVRAECVFMGQGIDYLATQRNAEWYIATLADEKLAWIRFVPRGWLYQNALFAVESMYERVLPLVNARERRVYPALAATNAAYMEWVPASPYNFFVKHFGLVFHSSRFAKTQTSIDLAAVACGLERYRLQSGSCPEQLELLAPKYISVLPRDVITGESLRYRRSDNDQFVLYSVGWNTRDDGGEFPNVEAEKIGFERRKGEPREEGDWVWHPVVPVTQQK